MTGKTHLIIGAGSGAALALVTAAPTGSGLAMIAAAAIGALLPDIDSQNSMISQRLWFLRILIFWIPHRTLTHSIFALLAVTTMAYFAALSFGGIVAYALVAGYASHIIADMATTDGVPLLCPVWYRRLHILPPFVRVTTGGMVESLLYILSCAGLVYLLILVLRIIP